MLSFNKNKKSKRTSFLLLKRIFLFIRRINIRFFLRAQNYGFDVKIKLY